VIISFRQRFVFVAVPKTATHAFRVALRPHLGERDWEQCVLFEKKYFPVEALAQIGHGHITCRQVQPFLLPGMWGNFFKFCTVRNPFDRFVSCCYFVNRENQLLRKEPLDAMKRIIQDKQLAKEILFRPQYEFMTDVDGQLMVDYVCKFETLQSDFDRVCGRLNLPLTTLKHINTNKHGSFESVYDEELKEMVREFYQKDFALFNYPTEIGETSQSL
jgi:hypothetical protein